VLPGYGAGDGSTAVLRAYLRWLGYRPRGWGLGRNHGGVRTLLPQILTALDRTVDEMGGPVALIGWSMGGYLAREVARDRPDAVRQVITLGSPVVGGPKYTVTARRYQRRGYDLDEIEAQVKERTATPLQVPVLAIYSKSDAVVAWQACIDHDHALTHHVEVRSTHLGLGFSPRVYRLLARGLSSAGRSLS
jgi:pimeloyl-ACP methyl ester carboxylesterase